MAHKIWRKLLAASAAVIALSSCGGGGGGGLMAPSGPNPIHGALIASGLNSPMQYVTNPSDRTLAYVIERAGRIRVLVNDSLQLAPVLDISGTVVTDGECGLLGMTFDPQFASNRFFYLHYDAGNPIESRIVRYTMDPSGRTAGAQFPILSFKQTAFTNHKGGALNFGPDGMLYLAFGDGGSSDDPNNYAQDPGVFFGKMLRIDPHGDDFPADPNQNYAIPPSNPWVGISGVKGEIWDFGLRNPFRWCFDPVTGGILIGDVGQGAFEEVDYEPSATGHRNYGWRMREGLHPSGDAGPAFFTPLTDPFYDYSHSVGQCIIGGFVYRGSGLANALQNRYFFGDYTTGRIWSIPFATGAGGEASSTSFKFVYDHTPTINSTLKAAAISGPVSVTPDANGEIVICDLNKGSLIRLVK